MPFLLPGEVIPGAAWQYWPPWLRGYVEHTTTALPSFKHFHLSSTYAASTVTQRLSFQQVRVFVSLGGGDPRKSLEKTLTRNI